jgi:hypothetical protein
MRHDSDAGDAHGPPLGGAGHSPTERADVTHKVGSAVPYERGGRGGRVISHHTNPWIGTRQDVHWEIALRSY